MRCSELNLFNAPFNLFIQIQEISSIR